MAGKFEALRTAGRDGYDTTSKDTFDNQVVFTLDYSSLELGMKEARNMIADFGKELKDSMEGVNTEKGTYFVYAKSDFKKSYTTTSADILIPKAKDIDNVVYRAGKGISALSKDTIKKYIGSRVETGDMKGSIYGRTSKSKGQVVSRAGWLDLWYKYFGYQEEGTKTISPMHSILRTYLEVAPQVQRAMSELVRKSTKGGGFKE
jgi:hypothetical protein